MGQVPSFGSAMAQGAQAGLGTVSSAQQIKQSEATIQNLIAQTRLVNTKQGTELAKSEVFKAIAPIIAQAGKDFGALVEFIKDPARLEEFAYLLSQANKTVLDGLDTVLYDIFGGNYKGSVVEKMIHLGSGGPK